MAIPKTTWFVRKKGESEMRKCVFAVLSLTMVTAQFCSMAAQTPGPAQKQTGKAELHAAQTDEGKALAASKIRSGAKIFINPMEGGFENFIVAGMQKKKVPLVVVIDRSKADYEISGISNSEKAGWAKMLFMSSQQSNEEASIKVTDLETGTILFAYSVHKTNSYKGRQSAGEACAKHLKEAIE